MIRIFFFMLALTFCFACQPQAQNRGTGSSEAKEATQQKTQNINSSEVARLVTEKKAILLDVRTPGEVSEGKMGDAIVINYNDKNFKQEVAKLDKSKSYVVYCAAGSRSRKACDYMVSEGFTGVYNVEDGYSGWEASNKKKD